MSRENLVSCRIGRINLEANFSLLLDAANSSILELLTANCMVSFSTTLQKLELFPFSVPSPKIA